MKKVRLQDLDCIDDRYYVGNLIDIDSNPWVTEGEAEEVLEIVNSHVDAFVEQIFLVD